MKHHVYLSLGSNLGNRHALLRQAIVHLQQRVGSLVACSSFIETLPWGFESEHNFLNAVVWCTTDLEPEEVLLVTQQIEREMGRHTKSDDNGYHDRTIDIDILLFDDLSLNTWVGEGEEAKQLIIPHPLMHQRDFVMKPLQEIHSM
ncbi:MAG: 2-amino-4-hydroxy-6-hydroxymethyldihydropteridine diphosphokinase [Bacteroidaceae bacterium]|nr:2-amino-4-hydroxy-6-hydroxymethyldihydropteridine diphosphokinase [Bacteroidaceae bacterium]